MYPSLQYNFRDFNQLQSIQHGALIIPLAILRARDALLQLCAQTIFRSKTDSLMQCFLAQDGSCEAYTVTNSSTSGIPGKKRRNYAGGKAYYRSFPFVINYINI